MEKLGARGWLLTVHNLAIIYLFIDDLFFSRDFVLVKHWLVLVIWFVYTFALGLGACKKLYFVAIKTVYA